jgi:hypothetical protein
MTVPVAFCTDTWPEEIDTDPEEIDTDTVPDTVTAGVPVIDTVPEVTVTAGEPVIDTTPATVSEPEPVFLTAITWPALTFMLTAPEIDTVPLVTVLTEPEMATVPDEMATVPELTLTDGVPEMATVPAVSVPMVVTVVSEPRTLTFVLILPTTPTDVREPPMVMLPPEMVTGGMLTKPTAYTATGVGPAWALPRNWTTWTRA